MTTNSDQPTPTAWARFRFSVVGSLLSSPPAHGELKAALEALAGKTWTHPAHGREVHFSAVTIERWYYKARREKDDPVGVLRRALRKDCGKVSLPPRLAERLFAQYKAHKHWTYQLHYDNLGAAAKADPSLGTPGSYSTVRRYMQAHGMVRKPRATKGTPGEIRAARRREEREVRSYEAEYVGALWHLDFHHGSLPVLTPRGQWEKPLALGILDDCSRLCCHLQWYLSEAAEDLTHGLSQGIQKRGLFRSLMSDNGGAMVADEVTEGLLRLGIVHERTLPYSPYQNGKQECFWATLEGRLMEMLEGVTELSLDFLNQATQAWVEDGVQPHAAPRDGLLAGGAARRSTSVLRPSPSSAALRNAFRKEVKRRQRQSNGTISLEGVRFEIPGRFRHFRNVRVRYASWDLSHVDLVDHRNGTLLAPIYPLDRRANADGQRLLFEPLAAAEGGKPRASQRPEEEIPPLLKRLLAEYSATGLPPAYLPKSPRPAPGQGETP